MRKIILHGPAVDRTGAFRDAGSTLVVGAADNADADIDTARADELLASGIAVTLTEEREGETISAEVAADEPAALTQLDHDGDGEPGGSLPRRAKRAA